MREWTAEPVSRDQILRRERGQRNIHVFCSADHEQHIGNLTRLISVTVQLILLILQKHVRCAVIASRNGCCFEITLQLFFLNVQVLRVIDYTLYKIETSMADNLIDRYGRPWLCSSR